MGNLSQELLRRCSIEDYMQDVDVTLTRIRRHEKRHAEILKLAQDVADLWAFDLFAEMGKRVSQIYCCSYMCQVELFFALDDTAATMLKFLRKVRLKIPKDFKGSTPVTDQSEAAVSFYYRRKEDVEGGSTAFKIKFRISTSGKCVGKQVTRTIQETTYNCADALGSFTKELSSPELKSLTS